MVENTRVNTFLGSQLDTQDEKVGYEISNSRMHI